VSTLRDDVLAVCADFAGGFAVDAEAFEPAVPVRVAGFAVGDAGLAADAERVPADDGVRVAEVPDP
jgi:hypothetical protein